jgi:hypothetical protein
LTRFSADGRVVCLGPAALQAWVNAGARSLDKKSEINFSDRLSDPLKLRDIFPELGKIIGNKELANALARKADAVWVSGLSEITGPIEGHPTIARDATGLFSARSRAFRRLALERSDLGRADHARPPRYASQRCPKPHGSAGDLTS